MIPSIPSIPSHSTERIYQPAAPPEPTDWGYVFADGDQIFADGDAVMVPSF